MSLFISEKDLVSWRRGGRPSFGSMKTLFVYRNECNMMVATRSPNYHSKPHKHVPEQLNYVIAGELWAFMRGEGFHLKTGDFLRIPGNDSHWAWNCGDTPCTMVQAQVSRSRAGASGRHRRSVRSRRDAAGEKVAAVGHNRHRRHTHRATRARQTRHYHLIDQISRSLVLISNRHQALGGAQIVLAISSATVVSESPRIGSACRSPPLAGSG